MSSLWHQFTSSEFQLQLAAPLGMAAFQCLAAIWAGTNKTHWFWRALAVWAAVMLMVQIRAWEPARLFALSSLLIVAGLSIQRWAAQKGALTAAPARNTGAPKWRFTLRDLLGLILIIGLWLPAILETHRAGLVINWLGWLVASVSLAALALTSYALVVSPRRWLDVGLVSLALAEIGLAIWANAMLELPLAVGLLLVVCGSTAAVAALAAYGVGFPWRHWLALLVLVVLLPVCATAVYLAGPWMRGADPLNALTGTMAFKIIRLSLIFSELSALLILLIALAHGARSADVSKQRPIACGGALGLIGGAAVLWLGSIYLDVLRETAPRWPMLRTDVRSLQVYRVQRIASEIRHVNDQIGNWQPLCIADLPANPAYAPARAKLTDLYQQLQPVLQSVSAEDPESSAKAKAGSYRGLIASWDFNVVSRQLLAEFDSDVTKENWDAATDHALALVQLGDILARGGIESETRMGSEIRANGHERLIQIRERVPPSRLRSVISSLARSQQDRGDPALIRARQLDYEELAYGWSSRYQRVLARRLPKRHDPPGDYAERHYASWDLQCLLVSPLLQADLAVRLFQHDHGRLPHDLGELVPTYYESIPVDEYSQRLVLKATASGFMVYSIGWDGRDDGATFSTWPDYETGHRRWQRDKGTWITYERRDGEPREYMGQPGIDFDLGTPTRAVVEE